MEQVIKTQMVGIDEWYVNATNTIYVTTLGSCVAVILWDPVHHISAMNHFLLPNRSGLDRSHPKSSDVEEHKLITNMIEQVIKKGGNIRNLKAMIVGGGESFYDHYKIGPKNVQRAIQTLEKFEIDNYQVCAGGKYSRKVKFDSAEGKVTIQKISIGEKKPTEYEVIYF